MECLNGCSTATNLCPRGALDVIYEDLPLLSFVYKEFQYAFQTYFADLKNPK
jgi:hypothetical protein